MRLFHLLAMHWPGNHSGVPRFSRYFMEAFPQVKNITPDQVASIDWRDDDVCVTDNHLVMRLPERVRAIVVHHGCAPFHHQVDPEWRGLEISRMVGDQIKMLGRPNTEWVAPSLFVGALFSNLARTHNAEYLVRGIPHWVPEIPPPKFSFARSRPVVLGDWRNHNKGRDAWKAIAAACPDFDFRQLEHDGSDPAREACYQNADIYLCLSLSEGAPYSVADAEAAHLPIVSTNVGFISEFEASIVPIFNRDDVQEVAAAIRRAAAMDRPRHRGFYSAYPFSLWRALWRGAFDRALL